MAAVGAETAAKQAVENEFNLIREGKLDDIKTDSNLHVAIKNHVDAVNNSKMVDIERDLAKDMLIDNEARMKRASKKFGYPVNPNPFITDLAYSQRRSEAIQKLQDQEDLERVAPQGHHGGKRKKRTRKRKIHKKKSQHKKSKTHRKKHHKKTHRKY